MQFITLFLLTGWLSIANAMDPDVQNRLYQLEINIEKSVDKKCPIKLGSSGYVLTQFEYVSYQRGFLPKMKGKLNHGKDIKEVGVRFFITEDDFLREKKIYEALEAIGNHEIEKHGIPQIFYCGKMFNAYAIVMTLFDKSWFVFWPSRREKVNEYTTLEVFLQLVKTLKYMYSKGVAHNHIIEDNIFLCGNRIFVANFDKATINGEESSGLREDHPMTAMDDLKSVVYIIWIMIDWPQIFRSDWMEKENSEKKIEIAKHNCEHFKNYPAAKRACLFICKDEALSNKVVPDYVKIIQYLEEALHDLETNYNQKWIY